ncbi:MAG TPA: sensor histidine kinase [Vicinamibacterales bacterium]|nr:sensor histidine kinase [Vicinamibacterales bacterium]
MTGIRARFAAFVAVAAVAPLLAYGFVSVRSLQRATEESVAAGNLAVARQVAERFRDYFVSNKRVLDSVGSQLTGTQLAPWQQAIVLRNHVIDFPELTEMSLLDARGRPIVSTRSHPAPFEAPADRPDQDFVILPPELDEDRLPTTYIAVRLRERQGQGSWLVAEISLEELWRAVDSIRIGRHGYAMLIDQNGRFIAHGDPDKKALIANRVIASPDERRLAAMMETSERPVLPRVATDGGTMVAVAARIGTPDWTVIIEQPEWEALAVAHRVQRQLSVAIGIALLATVLAGSWWGRSFLRRIFALARVTQDLAAGQMTARVAVSGSDEIAQLGRQFNAMADRLEELQEEIRRQERQAMFGRIAAGLVHDLSHPIQTISNNCKLIQRIFDDAEYRATFRETIEREIATVKRVLEDLLNIARPKPIERFHVDLNAALADALRTMGPLAETAGLTLRQELSREPLYIQGDLFALGRVHRNLILNAIQATAPGGEVVVATRAAGDRVLVSIQDTGCGIPAERLEAIFEDFVTTKKRGLGLGLAISRKIVEQLGGRIRVSSEVGRGTTFVLDFPAATAVPARIAG